MKDKAEIFDIETYDNTMFFCMNCANLMTVFFNADGIGKAHCPVCNCRIVVKRCRRKYTFELFEPKHNKMYIPPEFERLLNSKPG